MCWSRFVHVMNINGKHILFHAVNKKVLIMDKFDFPRYGYNNERPELSTLSDELLGLLSENEYICDFDGDDDLLKKGDMPEISLENLRILVTNKCNLNCLYCQIQKNMSNQDSASMTVDMARDVVDWFLINRNKEKNASITITGGEPLVSIEVVKFIVEYVRLKCPTARVTLFTNGTLITEAIARFLKDYDVFVIISIDGSEVMHNRTRVATDNINSFGMTIKGYEFLKSEHVKFGVSAVMPDSYVDYIAMIEFFCTLKPLSVGINYRHQLLNQCFDVDFSEHGKRIVQALDLFVANGIYFENYERYKKAFIGQVLRTRECQSCGRGVTVDSRGYIGTCKSLLISDLNVCNFKDFDYLKSKMVSEWASRTPLVDEECKDCYAISICGGGCAYDSYVIYDGDYKKCDKRICPFMRKVVDKLLLDVVSQHALDEGVVSTLSNNLIDPMIQSVGH